MLIQIDLLIILGVILTCLQTFKTLELPLKLNLILSTSVPLVMILINILIQNGFLVKEKIRWMLTPLKHFLLRRAPRLFDLLRLKFSVFRFCNEFCEPEKCRELIMVTSTRFIHEFEGFNPVFYEWKNRGIHLDNYYIDYFQLQYLNYGKPGDRREKLFLTGASMGFFKNGFGIPELDYKLKIFKKSVENLEDSEVIKKVNMTNYSFGREGAFFYFNRDSIFHVFKTGDHTHVEFYLCGSKIFSVSEKSRNSFQAIKDNFERMIRNVNNSLIISEGPKYTHTFGPYEVVKECLHGTLVLFTSETTNRRGYVYTNSEEISLNISENLLNYYKSKFKESLVPMIHLLKHYISGDLEVEVINEFINKRVPSSRKYYKGDLSSSVKRRIRSDMNYLKVNLGLFKTPFCEEMKPSGVVKLIVSKIKKGDYKNTLVKQSELYVKKRLAELGKRENDLELKKPTPLNKGEALLNFKAKLKSTLDKFSELEVLQLGNVEMSERSEILGNESTKIWSFLRKGLEDVRELRMAIENNNQKNKNYIMRRMRKPELESINSMIGRFGLKMDFGREETIPDYEEIDKIESGLKERQEFLDLVKPSISKSYLENSERINVFKSKNDKSLKYGNEKSVESKNLYEALRLLKNFDGSVEPHVDDEEDNGEKEKFRFIKKINRKDIRSVVKYKKMKKKGGVKNGNLDESIILGSSFVKMKKLDKGLEKSNTLAGTSDEAFLLSEIKDERIHNQTLSKINFHLKEEVKRRETKIKGEKTKVKRSQLKNLSGLISLSRRVKASGLQCYGKVSNERFQPRSQASINETIHLYLRNLKNFVSDVFCQENALCGEILEIIKESESANSKLNREKAKEIVDEMVNRYVEEKKKKNSLSASSSQMK